MPWGLVKGWVMAPSAKLGFNGVVHEPGTERQLLGNGYRVYDPVLMRFYSADSLSPFGRGGMNAYAYCKGDPQNHIDPSGHFPWAWLGVATAVATGVAATVGAVAVEDRGVKAILGSVALLSVLTAGVVFARYTPSGRQLLGKFDPRVHQSGGGSVVSRHAPARSSSRSTVSAQGSLSTRSSVSSRGGDAQQHGVPMQAQRRGSVGSDVELPQFPRSRSGSADSGYGPGVVSPGASARSVRLSRNDSIYSSTSSLGLGGGPSQDIDGMARLNMLVRGNRQPGGISQGYGYPSSSDA